MSEDGQPDSANGTGRTGAEPPVGARRGVRSGPGHALHPLLGWREWVSFPDHGPLWIKAKVDTGARTSAIHARNISTFARKGKRWVRFTVAPWQGSTRDAVEVEAPLEDERWVRSSSGHREFRPVVLLPVQIAGRTHTAEFTLSHRPQMGFRVLLGRQAIRGRYQVDPGQSYLGERPPVQVRERNRHNDEAELRTGTAAAPRRAARAASSTSARANG